ncbi:hypothetical protein [Fodinicola feengrottensis]|uniref:hypothetical protein n=1 Tax=Fodinicola feengrottensis TaxID=435914 RepID=UPI0013D57F9C|nr:hypothetical protein [Fodinicola feengrottensis]
MPGVRVGPYASGWVQPAGGGGCAHRRPPLGAGGARLTSRSVHVMGPILPYEQRG